LLWYWWWANHSLSAYSATLCASALIEPPRPFRSAANHRRGAEGRRGRRKLLATAGRARSPLQEIVARQKFLDACIEPQRFGATEAAVFAAWDSDQPVRHVGFFERLLQANGMAVGDRRVGVAVNRQSRG